MRGAAEDIAAMPPALRWPILRERSRGASAQEPDNEAERTDSRRYKATTMTRKAQPQRPQSREVVRALLVNEATHGKQHRRRTTARREKCYIQCRAPCGVALRPHVSANGAAVARQLIHSHTPTPSQRRAPDAYVAIWANDMIGRSTDPAFGQRPAPNLTPKRRNNATRTSM